MVEEAKHYPDKDHEWYPFSDVCISCSHLWQDGVGRTCKAFPEGIPDDIWMGSNKHTKIHPEQKNKVVYQRITKYDFKGTPELLEAQREWIEDYLGLPDCAECEHYIGPGYCQAFPDGIPLDIITGEVIHDKKHPEQFDNDLIFEPSRPIEEGLITPPGVKEK